MVSSVDYNDYARRGVHCRIVSGLTDYAACCRDNLVNNCTKLQNGPNAFDLISTGDAGWVVRRLNKGLGEDDADFIDRAKMDYDGIVAYSIQVERDRAVEADTFDRRRFQVNR